MEELKIEYKFDLKDFEMMENIEHLYFPNENITPAEEVLNWYKKNNLTCIGRLFWTKIFSFSRFEHI